MGGGTEALMEIEKEIHIDVISCTPIMPSAANSDAFTFCAALMKASTEIILHLSPRLFRAQVIRERSSTDSSSIPLEATHRYSL